MYIASSYDQGSGWTLRKPSVMVMIYLLLYFFSVLYFLFLLLFSFFVHFSCKYQVTNRLADLARTSLQVLQESIQRDDPHHWKVKLSFYFLILFIHLLSPLS